MHLHRPKPLHGWREIATEIAVIVVGIAIAIGGEQTVEALHWRGEVAETRTAIDTELAHDLGVVEYRIAQTDCVERRIADLNAWYQSWKAGHPRKLSRRIGQPSRYSFYTEAWEVAETGQVATHIPLQERMKYAQIYGMIRVLDARRIQEGDTWLSLDAFDDADQLDHGDLMRLHGQIRTLETTQFSYGLNYHMLLERAAALGVKSEKLPPIQANDASFCRSLFDASDTGAAR